MGALLVRGHSSNQTGCAGEPADATEPPLGGLNFHRMNGSGSSDSSRGPRVCKLRYRTLDASESSSFACQRKFPEEIGYG